MTVNRVCGSGAQAIVSAGQDILLGNVDVAVGPVGKGLSASTTTNFSSDAYSFAKTQGAYVGISLDGAGILSRESRNVEYYGTGATSAGIVIQRKFTNKNADILRDALSPY